MAAALKIIKASSDQIPELRSVSKQIASLEDKAAELADRKREFLAERYRLLETLAGRDLMPAMPKHSESPHARADASAIAELLGEAPPAPPPPSLPSEDERLHHVNSEIRKIELAERELERRLAVERAAASPMVCENVRPRHEALVRNLLNAVVAVHEANRDYAAFGDAMNAAKVSWGELAPFFPRFLGDPLDRNSGISQFLLEAVQGGWLAEDRLPKELRS